MNGAIADDWAKTIRMPRASSTNTIGIIHQSLRSHMNDISSPMMPMRRPALLNDLGMVPSRLAHDAIAQHEHVHLAAREGRVRLARSVDDGLAAEVERRIEHHRHAGGLAEFRDQVVVDGV